jgi:hypothetical protein
VVRRILMAKKNTARKGKAPLFKKGDRISFLFGTTPVSGQIIEDRGCLGVVGRRLYGIRFEINPEDPRYIEMPEEEITAVPTVNTNS